MSDHDMSLPEGTMTLDQAQEIIGITPADPIENILLKFRETYLAYYRGEKSNSPSEIVLAKNLIVRASISLQMEKNRRFEIISPFENTCIRCRGTGELYKLKRKPVDVTCHVCIGKGKVLGTCPTCKGTTRYIKHFKEGGGINVTCRTCEDTPGKAMIKCQQCLEKGTVRKIVPDHNLKSTTPCKACDELGFIEKRKPKKKKPYVTPEIGTPVLDATHAAKLTQLIQASTPK